MQSSSQFWPKILFIFRAILTSKQGLSGLFVALFGTVWWLLGLWQAFDFLQDNKPVLANLLESFWGPLLVMVLGFVVLYRVVSARWPATQATPLETETAASGQHAETHTTAEKPSGDVYEELRRRCRELADELRQFLEDNENLDEEQIMRLYRRRLGDKASALLEELEEHGLYPPPNLKSYQLAANANPLSPFAIRNLARTLGTIGHKQPAAEQPIPDEPFSLEPMKRRGPPKPNGEFDIYMSIRVANKGSGWIRGCRGRLVRVQDLVSTPDGSEWRDLPHIHPALLQWSPGDGGGDSADFTTVATLDVALIESWTEPVYQLLTANESLRSTYQLEYGQVGPVLTIEISAQSGGRIEQTFTLDGHLRGFLEAPTEVEPEVRWRTWPT